MQKLAQLNASSHQMATSNSHCGEFTYLSFDLCDHREMLQEELAKISAIKTLKVCTDKRISDKLQQAIEQCDRAVNDALECGTLWEAVGRQLWQLVQTSPTSADAHKIEAVHAIYRELVTSLGSTTKCLDLCTGANKEALRGIQREMAELGDPRPVPIRSERSSVA